MKLVSGFTLIELMIVVFIVAVLASVAYPSYTQYTDRAKRADGHAFLLDVASRQERFFTANVSYTSVLVGNQGLNYADANSVEGHYSIALEATPAGCGPGGVSCTFYRATATPTVAGRPECTTLTYDSLGVKGSTGTSPTEVCWR